MTSGSSAHCAFQLLLELAAKTTKATPNKTRKMVRVALGSGVAAVVPCGRAMNCAPWGCVFQRTVSSMLCVRTMAWARGACVVPPLGPSSTWGSLPLWVWFRIFWEGVRHGHHTVSHFGAPVDCVCFATTAMHSQLCRSIGRRCLSTMSMLPKRVRIVEVGPRDGLQVRRASARAQTTSQILFLDAKPTPCLTNQPHPRPCLGRPPPCYHHCVFLAPN
jgi:hypothetical protein